MKEKDRKEKMKRENLEKQRLLSQRWAMQRWITNFIHEHEEQWEKERTEKEKESQKELDRWVKMKRFQKKEISRKKWHKEPHTTEEAEKHQTVHHQNTQMINGTCGGRENFQRQKKTIYPRSSLK